jgi:type I restriction enzyme S subunit
MKSIYKRIGDYIREVDVRNTGLKVKNLLGLSISKQFIPSVANIVGTDMENYKIIRKNQFACSIMQVRRDKKMPVALLKEVDEAIISQAYPVFEIVDTNVLMPEYLMMWFSRQEFDREACFYAVGGVRGSLEWGDFLDMKLPVPSIDKQKEIVKEYNVIINRIELNNKLIKRLEETAQSVYKQWFVDFEFPDENGKPYKSSGGEMIFNEKLEKEIPKGWKLGKLSDVYSFQYGYGNTNPANGGKYPVYGSNGIIGGYDQFNNEDAPVIGHIGENCGSVVYAPGKHYVTYNGVMCNINKEFNKYFGYCTLLNKDLKSQTRGSSQPFVSYDMLYEIDVILPDKKLIIKTGNILDSLFDKAINHRKQIYLLNRIKNLLLSKLATIEN